VAGGLGTTLGRGATFDEDDGDDSEIGKTVYRTVFVNGVHVPDCICIERRWIEKRHPSWSWWCWHTITCMGHSSCAVEFLDRFDCTPRPPPPLPPPPERPWWYDLPPCPESIVEAEASDRFCSEGENKEHPGSHVCYRQVVTEKGPGQQCCYAADGTLITEGPGAGTPDKVAVAQGFIEEIRAAARQQAIEWGEDPNRIDPRVPNCAMSLLWAWSHYWADVNPYRILKGEGRLDEYLRLWPPSGSIEEHIQRALYDWAAHRR
jgi:hypothetical protein